MKKLLVLLIIFSNILNIKAQDYTLDFKDPSSYSVTCGSINPAQWEVKKDSCVLYTPTLYPVTGGLDSIMVYFTVKINQSGNLSTTDNAYIHMKRNSGPYVMKRLYQGAGSPCVVEYKDSAKMAKNDNFEFRIIMENNDKTKFWQIKDGDITVVNATSSSILPVELLTFTAKIDRNSIILNWITASETNNDYFVIEKTPDFKPFTRWSEVGYIDGQGTINSITLYEHIDDTPYRGLTYYRLKQVDFDGKITYSTPIVINWIDDDNFSYTIVPNPTGENNVTIYINYSSKVLNALLVSVYDENGNQIYTSDVCIMDNCIINININNTFFI
jgi:hypothetical protein